MTTGTATEAIMAGITTPESLSRAPSPPATLTDTRPAGSPGT